MDRRAPQRIRYLRTSDGVKLAWADAGVGPVLIKAANWLTHLEYEWESPVWQHWLRFFSAHFRLVRYDERGCGMTDWNVGDLSQARRADDLEAVVDAAGAPERFVLLGISQGAASCVTYAARHPERVERLVIYGGYTRGWAHRGLGDGEREYQAIIELVRVGWGRDNPAFRRVFTSRFIPGATTEQMVWFDDLCKRTTSPEVAAQLLTARAHLNVIDALGSVRAPTLVLHARDDAVVPLSEGRLIAAGIAGAEFIELDSKNHILLDREPAWARFRDAVLEFTGLRSAAGDHTAFDRLTVRERGVLALITQGLSNAEIAERLGLSEKTVRNHVSNVFDKLGVWTRAQAIVFARDRGFSG